MVRINTRIVRIVITKFGIVRKITKMVKIITRIIKIDTGLIRIGTRMVKKSC